MEKEDYKFTFVKENGEEVECEVIYSFYNEELEKTYMYFTDNQKDEEGNLNVYIYYNNLGEEELLPVEDKEEWEILNKKFAALMEEEK